MKMECVHVSLLLHYRTNAEALRELQSFTGGKQLNAQAWNQFLAEKLTVPHFE